MAFIILAVAFVTETAFAAYCILTRSGQRRVRGFVRIGALAAFVLFTLVSIVQWSFRWYGLAALLFILAVLGVWTVLGRKPEKTGYRPGIVVLKAIGTMLLVGLTIVPALAFPQARAPKVTGKHAVATVSYTYTDKSRTETLAHSGGNRKVNVEFWYPKGASGRYPLVVFSHGAAGVKASNTSTFTELASNGYVVCSIDHPYDSLYTIDADHHLVTIDPAFFHAVIDLNNDKFDEATTLKLQHQWMRLRIADISFVLDTILAHAREEGSGAVYQLVDTRKIGLMGHSLGGESSVQLARERNDIGAVVNLDADLGGEYLDYVDGAYVMNATVYPVPLLSILADDVVRLIAAVPNADTVVALRRVLTSAPKAFEVHIAGTDHQSLTDLPIVSPFLVWIITGTVKKAGGGETADKYQVIEKMNDIVLSFFNAFLKNEGTFSAE